MPCAATPTTEEAVPKGGTSKKLLKERHWRGLSDRDYVLLKRHIYVEPGSPTEQLVKGVEELEIDGEQIPIKVAPIPTPVEAVQSIPREERRRIIRETIERHQVPARAAVGELYRAVEKEIEQLRRLQRTTAEDDAILTILMALATLH